MDCRRRGRVGQLAVVFFVSAVLAGAALGDVKLPAVIGDNMVLQQGMQVPIWGWAEAGEKVTVIASWGGKKWEAAADADGKWMVKVDTPAAGGPAKGEVSPAGGPYEVTIAGKNTFLLKNVLVGEVWVCSGQSNMEWSLGQATDANEEIRAADLPNIRLFTVAKRVSEEPQKDCQGRWEQCSPQTAGKFSAVGFFFGRYLHSQMNVPIGLIHTSWGGTPAEAWTSKDWLAKDADFEPIVKRFEDAVKDYPRLKEKYEQEMKKQEEDAAKLKAESKPVPRRPRIEPPMGPGNSNSPAGLYNAMLAPIIPFGIRGAIWYQGEANADRAYQYRKLLPAMISCWRDKWGQGDFAFLIVQLANYMPVSPEPVESEWAELREAQTMTLAVPNTGMAVTIDIGEANDIHPKNKQDVGKRLALWALAKTYGKDVVYSGPSYKAMKVDGNRVILSFDHIGGGLVAGGGESLKGFSIAGADRKFVWADAKIEGDTVVVTAEEVAAPVAARYGWANNPVCNFRNKAGLPASPFRTDDWLGMTDGRK